jgi:hypothetical protein
MIRMVRSHLTRALLVFLSLGLVLYSAAAQTPVLLRVIPAEAQVVAGQTVDVAVEVVDVEDLYAFDVALTFDPSVVEVVDADPNVPGIQIALGTFLDPGFSIINEADNVAGTAHLAMTQLNPSTPKSGTGSLLVVKLRGKQAGTSSAISIVNGQLARPDGTLIPTAPPVGGVVYVVPSGDGTQTATPMPTQGGGTPMPTPLETMPPLPPTLTPTAGPGTATPGPTQTGAPQPTLTPEATAATPGTTPAPTITATAITSATATASSVAATPSANPTKPSATLSAATKAIGPTAPSERSTSSGSVRTLLWIGLGALALAALAGAGALALWLRQRRSAPGGGSGTE